MKITQEQFDDKLMEILKSMNGAELLTHIPEIYSELVEYFNNEIIDAIQADFDEDE
jgi:hypothetical protein